MNSSFWFKVPENLAEQRKQIGLLAVITVLALLPFVNKPFHIDDPLWQDFGKLFFNVDSFYTTPYYMFGNRYETIIDSPHPTVVPFINFLIFNFSDDPPEYAFHLVFLPFAVLSAAFTYCLALRFRVAPMLPALALLFSPPFFILATSLMTDVILYAFLTGSLLFYIRAVDGGDLKYLAAAVVMFSLAIATGFQALTFYAAFFLYFWIQNPRRFGYFFAMGIAVVPMILWYGYHYRLIGKFPDPLHLIVLDALSKKVQPLYFLSQFALAYVVPIGFVCAWLKPKYWKAFLISGVLAWALFKFAGHGVFADYTLTQKGVFWLGGCFTFFILWTGATRLYEGFRSDQSEQARDSRFLWSFVFIFFIVVLGFTPFATSRYFFPIMGMVYILLLSQTANLRRPVVMATLALAAVASLATAKADYNFAAFCKQFPKEVAQRVTAKDRVWFVGEWGFRAYMAKAGYPQLMREGTVKAGEFIVEPTIISRLWVDWLDFPRRLKKRLVIRTGDAINIFNYEAHAGFWGQHWGMLPFWPGNKPQETVRIFEVQPDIIPFDLLGEMGSIDFPLGQKLETVKLSGDSRSALSAGTNAPLAVKLKPGGKYNLQFGIAALAGSAGGGKPVVFRIVARSASGDVAIYETPAVPVDQSASRWIDADLSLEAFAGKPVELIFQTILPDGYQGQAYWSSINLVETEIVRI